MTDHSIQSRTRTIRAGVSILLTRCACGAELVSVTADGAVRDFQSHQRADAALTGSQRVAARAA